MTFGNRSGVARKVDQLGRVVLPAEVRREFGIKPGDLLDITVDTGVIRLSKVEDRCVFCGSQTALVEFADKLVCRECADALSGTRPPRLSSWPPRQHREIRRGESH